MFSDPRIQSDRLSRKHFRITDPEGRHQLELEEGLGSLVTKLRQEMEQAEEKEREAAVARSRSQERIQELRSGVREYRKALGLPEPSEDGGQPSPEQSAELRKLQAEADLEEERLKRHWPQGTESSNASSSSSKGQRDEYHKTD